MTKRLFFLPLFFFMLFFSYGNTHAATPFSAPASFDLTGSTIECSIHIDATHVGNVDMGLSPNPAPVTGAINVTQMQKETGVFTGDFDNISATMRPTANLLGLTVPVTVAVNSDVVSGWFVWNQDAVIFKPESLNITLTLGTQSWDIPTEGTYLPATYSNGILAIEGEFEYANSYLGHAFTADIGLHITGTLNQQAAGIPWIKLKTDRNSYGQGDSFKLYASLGNEGPALTLDLYLALLNPIGDLLFFPAYDESLTPALKDFEVPSGIFIPYTMLYDLTLPALSPPIDNSGEFQFLAVFVDPGTGSLVGEVASALFTYDGSTPCDHPYDGIWFGSGGSSVVTEDCPALASIRFDIAKSVITGFADSEREIDADGYEVTGTINPDGTIADGTLWEEIGPDLNPVGYFNGTFSGNSASGTWQDIYGCYGTLSVSKSE